MQTKLPFNVLKGIILLNLLALSYAQASYLNVQKEDGSSILLLSLEQNPCWIMRWNHSVTGVTVSDYYCFLEGQMLLMASHTPSFDAGLGHIPERGRLESDGFHGYFIFDINEAVPANRYVLRVGSVKVNHRIEHDNLTYSLSEKAANERVYITVLSKESK